MFRLITFVCLIQISVGTIIRGRILLNGNANQVETLPAGSRLLIRLEDSSMADAPVVVIKESEYLNLLALPISYRFQVPTDNSSGVSYSLSARIQKGDTLFYLNEVYVPVTPDTDGVITKDIPVINIRGDEVPTPLFDNTEQLSWPELVGREGSYAVEYIKGKTGFTNVLTIPEGSAVTMDYRTDRVRVFVNKKGIVTQTPRVG